MHKLCVTIVSTGAMSQDLLRTHGKSPQLHAMIIVWTYYAGVIAQQHLTVFWKRFL